ncbi:MAG: rod shape-determining protein MreD [Solirubrobacterales bacterium]|nr:rod shape-determining protein MreD [Solirubrobacterales bacterium]
MKLPAMLLVRLGLLALLSVIIETAAISEISVFGTSADITPLVVVAVALLLGAVPGALMGFVMGLLVDTMLLQTMGVSALVLTAIGYTVGRYREVRDPANTLTPVVIGVIATAASTLGFGLVEFLLGVDVPFNLLLVRDVFIMMVVNGVLALPVFIIVRWVLAPYLPDDPRRRRRRAYTTGGLSPLSRS